MVCVTIGEKIIKNICIVGGGNVGHYFLANFGKNENVSMRLLSSTPAVFGNQIESLDVTKDVLTVGKLDKVSADPAEVIADADMIIFTAPSNSYISLLKKIYPHTAEGTVLGFVPGTGGVEFLARDFIVNKKCPIFGTQRVPSGTKVVQKGVRVESLGNRKDIRIAGIPGSITRDVCCMFEMLMGIHSIALPNYLDVAFTPSNPILHTSRLYGLFHDYRDEDSWDEKLAFYSNWDDISSETLIGADSELQACCRKLERYDLTECLSLKDHYEIYDGTPGQTDVQKMTNKIRKLRYLKDYAPMCQNAQGKWIPDFTTRYFTEDFPFGLCLLENYCKICGVNAVMMQKIIAWVKSFISIDYTCLPLPENYGLKSIDDIYHYFEALESSFVSV